MSPFVQRLCLAAAVVLIGCEPPEERDDVLTPADRAAIARLDSTFVQGWLKDDTTAALSVFAADAILLPPNSTAVTGVPAIRAFWWPNDGSHTKITRFTQQIDEVSGTHSVAFVRAHSELGWDYAKGGKTQSQTSRSASMLIARRDSTGRWAITRQIWNATP